MPPADLRQLPKQERARATRAALLEAGLAAFAAKGHEQVSIVSDVLEPAGVSAGSFYHQFRDKTDLLVAVLDQHESMVRDDVAAAADAGRALSMEEAVAQGFAQFFDDLDAHEMAWRVLFNCRSSEDDRVQAAILQAQMGWVGQSMGQLTAAFDASDAELVDLASILWALGGGLSALYLEMPAEMRAERRAGLLDTVVRFTLAGLEEMLG